MFGPVVLNKDLLSKHSATCTVLVVGVYYSYIQVKVQATVQVPGTGLYSCTYRYLGVQLLVQILVLNFYYEITVLFYSTTFCTCTSISTEGSVHTRVLVLVLVQVLYSTQSIIYCDGNK